MRVRRRVGTVLLAIAVVAAVSPAGTGAQAAPGGSRPVSPGGGPAGAVHTVTLVTGDRVTVRTSGSNVSLVRIDTGPGRAKASFFTLQQGGHLRVIPSDVLPLLHGKKVDPRLFDVSTLVGYGYDERRKDLPLIVTGGAAAARGKTGLLPGVSASRTVPGGSAMKAAKANLPALWPQLSTALSARSAAASIEHLWLDGKRKVSLDQSVPQIGAPAAWAAGFTGTGVKVAVVDTGIDSDHPDLAGKVIAAQDFTGSGDTLDHVGHGTHVASTIASNDTRYRGVAPGAQLLSAKVCPDFGCDDSAILAGMQWAAEQGAKVVNMSLGKGDSPDLDPVEAAVNDLTARYGTLFVVAAGNSGANQSVESPGSADAALTVGAVTKSDELAFFSSRGPRTGDFAIKPDIAAPGQDIVAARSEDGVLGQPGELHMPLSGTSMATPHVAGAAAILLQEHPQWTPAQVKSALMGSARTLPGIDVFGQGAGRVDVAHAITQTVLADPPSVGFGLQQWPHTDDLPTRVGITYRNEGPTAVTLTLTISTSAPAGLFTLSDNRIFVPAGGTSTVTLTSDTRVNVPDGRYTGNLVATDGSTNTTIPFAVDKEVESYNVTVHHIDRTGQPAQNASDGSAFFFTGFFDPVTLEFLEVDTDGVPVRMPKGRYQVITGIYGPGSDATMLLDPDIVVDHNQELTIDARNARPVTVTVPQPDAEMQFQLAGGSVQYAPDAALTGIVYGGPEIQLYVGSDVPDRRSDSVHALLLDIYSKAGVDPVESPFVVQTMWRQNGHMFDGLVKRLKPADLATVRAEYASATPAGGFVRMFGQWPEGYVSALQPGAPINLPSTRVDYVNTDDGIRWIRTLEVFDEAGLNDATFLQSPPTRFEGGKTYQEKRDSAVFGPGFSATGAPEGWVGRTGDTMTLVPNVINDRLNWLGVPGAGDALRITLDREGTRVFDGTGFALVDVPPGDAQYRLGATVDRTGLGTVLSTKVSCEWTFRSGTVGGAQGVPLPMSAVRFLPQLDNRNSAPAGRLWPVPVEIQRQPGSAAGTARSLTVDVSYDDGAHWQRVPVIRVGQWGVALLTHPAGAGFVSLRASSTDSAGNTVNETVIRAYQIR